jgi:hypothetical protein
MKLAVSTEAFYSAQFLQLTQFICTNNLHAQTTIGSPNAAVAS